ncbi:DUF4184 family protein [Planctomycetaceae bacterium SH139]
MPFTVTHIAAAIPIAWCFRWRLPFSALAIGCMICDLSVFFPRLVSYQATHSMQGIVTHCLPLGLVAFFAYHWVLKQPLCALLPQRLARRTATWANQMPRLTIGHVSIIVGCLLFGAASHVLWDSFTHENRWGVRTFPVLNSIAIEFPSRAVCWYSVLQHGSSVVLLPPLLAGWLLWLYRQPQVAQTAAPGVPLSVKLVAILLLLVVPPIAWKLALQRFPGEPSYFIMHVAVKVAGGLLIASAVAYAIVYTMLSRVSLLERIEEGLEDGGNR